MAIVSLSLALCRTHLLLLLLVGSLELVAWSRDEVSGPVVSDQGLSCAGIVGCCIYAKVEPER